MWLNIICESDAEGASTRAAQLRCNLALNLLQILLIVVNLHFVHHFNKISVFKFHSWLEVGDPIGVVSSLQFVTLGVENREQGPRHEEVGNELRLAEPAEPLRGELQVNAFLVDLQCNELSHEEWSKACHNVADLERASKQHHLSGAKSYHTWHKGIHHLILYAF